MSTAETPPSSLEVAVAEDGSIQVPASEVARLGLGPGARLSLVPQPAPRVSRHSSWGVLAGELPDIAWEDFETASRMATADHEARYAPGGRWGQSVEEA